MPILNYTTQIEAEKTVSEIQQILGRHGAQAVSTKYELGVPVAIFFALEVQGAIVNFQLPCNIKGVLEVMTIDAAIRPAHCTEAQARRVAWRIVKDWVAAQLAIIESGQAQLAEVFLPYAITKTGQTLFQKMSEKPQLLLS